MGFKEWLIGWFKKRVLSHYVHHKSEVHRLTDIVIKDGMQDVITELIKQKKIDSVYETMAREYGRLIAIELDTRVDAAIDKWVEEQLGS